MKFHLIIILSLISYYCFGQEDSSSLNIKYSSEDHIESFIVQNKGDSVIMILSSVFYQAFKENHFVIIGLKEGINLYGITHMNDDSRFDPAMPIYRSTPILPNQEIPIYIDANSSNLPNEFYLLVRYCVLQDFDYYKHREETSQNNRWYRNYDWQRLELKCFNKHY